VSELKKAPNSGSFKPGQSGNPSGRPKTSFEFRQAMLELVPEAVRALREALTVAAATYIMNRVYGTPESCAKIDITSRTSVIDFIAQLGTAPPVAAVAGSTATHANSLADDVLPGRAE
jgi:hypothetical protein